MQEGREFEKRHLGEIADRSAYAAGLNRSSVEYSFEVLSRYFRGDSVLELGPAEGIMTAHMARMGMHLTVVEGAELFCRDLRLRYPGIDVVHSLFEDYSPGRAFDNIVIGHVLEHVQDPVDILKRAGAWLAPEGRILAVVPNSRSLHRQAAVLLGLLSAEDSLNELDLQHGHRRVFSPETFQGAFADAGLRVDEFGGYWLKAFANAQLETLCDEAMLRAFFRLGEEYPDVAAEIFVVAGREVECQRGDIDAAF